MSTNIGMEENMFISYLNKYRNDILGNDTDNGICYDGPVDKLKFLERENRLLFLLKETNGNDNDGKRNTSFNDWNYMEWVHQQATQEKPLYRSVYRNIVMWSKMFEVFSDEKREPSISEFIDSNGLIINSNILNSLLNVSIINLKKSWGNEKTDWESMNNYLNDNVIRKEILKYQISELKPTLVLCGGTFDFSYNIFGDGSDIKTITTNNGQIVKFFEHDATIFVNCYHPSKPRWSRRDSFIHMSNILKTIYM